MQVAPQKPRPIREDKPKVASIPRVPLDGYLSPRLRDQRTDAIGFVHNFEREEDV